MSSHGGHGGRDGDVRVQRGHLAADEPDHQRVLLEQGDLPPRADLQRLGRDGQDPVRGRDQP